MCIYIYIDARAFFFWSYSVYGDLIGGRMDERGERFFLAVETAKQ